MSRRRFIQLMGASIALAGLTACTRQPEESIVPFVQEPESTVPGKPKFYATSVTLGGLAQGVLVESHMGRLTKIEGNPQHPASLGAADAFGQASVLSLYDPDRSQAIQADYRTRLQSLSAGGILAYVLTMTFASFDWVMSLDAHWYSTLYGLIFVASQALSALAFAIIVVSRLADRSPLRSGLTTQRIHDLGNLLFAFVMLWAYLGFSQFLIIWSGNIAEEVPWYLHHSQGGWQWIAILLFLVHFALPFVLLLMRVMKCSLSALARVATVIFIVHGLDLFWLVLPELHPSRLTIHVMDILAPIGMGYIWVTLYVKLLHQRSLIPLEDRRLQEVPNHE